MRKKSVLPLFIFALFVLACGLPSAAPPEPTVNALPPTPNLPFSASPLPLVTDAPAETPFTGTWRGSDPDDGSIITLSLVQSGNSLTGTFADTFSGSVTPGYAGQGSGSVDSASTAQIAFSMTRGDGNTVVATFRLTLSDQNNTISMDCDTGCPIILQK